MPRGFVPLWWLFLPPSAECSALLWVAAQKSLGMQVAGGCAMLPTHSWPALRAIASVSGVGHCWV